MLPSIKLQEIEKNLFRKITFRDVFIQDNIYDIRSVKEYTPVVIHIPVDTHYMGNLSSLDLFQRTTDSWASYVVKRYLPIIKKALKAKYKIPLKIDTLGSNLPLRAKWNSDSIQFSLYIKPSNVIREIPTEKEDSSLFYVDVSDRVIIKTLRKYPLDFWKYLKDLSSNKNFLNRILSDNVDLKSLTLLKFLKAISSFDSHISFLNTDSKVIRKINQDKLSGDLKYTSDYNVGYIVKPFKKLNSSLYLTGIEIKWLDDSVYSFSNLDEVYGEYVDEFKKALDQSSHSVGEFKGSSGDNKDRVYIK